MNYAPLASIIVCNRNQGHYLKESIESVLSQTYSNLEIIVVDDASIDNSRQIIDAFKNRVIPFQDETHPAWDAGFGLTNGEVILLLDSGDILLSGAIEKIVRCFSHSNIVEVQWQAWGIDDYGRKKGRVLPQWPPPEGDLRELVARDGPYRCDSPPMTGFALSRSFLEDVLEGGFDLGGNIRTALSTLAPIAGQIRTIFEPQTCYRASEQNDYLLMPLHEKYMKLIAIYDDRCRVLHRYLQKKGIMISPDSWKKQPEYIFMQEVYAATLEIAASVPPDHAFILVDDNHWGTPLFADRKAIPFLERHGVYWGRPHDDAIAIREIERLRMQGANFIVFTCDTLWWLGYYASMNHYLRSYFRCLQDSDRLIVFDLRIARG